MLRYLASSLRAKSPKVCSCSRGSYHSRMNTPQSGIFALGTSSHAYLEFDVLNRKDAPELVRAISSLREPRTTIGGINLVVGFRPELWNRPSRKLRPLGFMDSTRTLSEWRISPCRVRSTTPCSGCQEARTTWFLTKRTKPSAPSRAWRPSPRRHPAGRISMIAI